MTVGPLWIGVDGGATSVRAVLFEDGPEGRLRPAGRRAVHDWITPTDFEPSPVAQQLAELTPEGTLPLDAVTGDEAVEATARIESVANLIAELTFGVRTTGARLGLCLAGRTAPDGRSIVACAQGPRWPRALERLAGACVGRNLTFERDPRRIHSDGEAAAWGEALGEGGALIGVRTGLVVGLGSGVAEAALVDVRPVPSVDLRAWGPAPWEAGADGRTIDARAGLRSLEAELVRRRGPGLRLADAARRGEPDAVAVLADGGRALGDHVAARVAAIEAQGARVEKVVMGQRILDLWTDAVLTRVHRDAFLERFPDPARLVRSRLRDAPALGALAAELGRVEALGSQSAS